MPVKKICSNCERITEYPLGMKPRQRCLVCKHALVPYKEPEATVEIPLIDGATYLCWDSMALEPVVTTITKVGTSWVWEHEAEFAELQPMKMLLNPSDYAMCHTFEEAAEVFAKTEGLLDDK